MVKGKDVAIEVRDTTVADQEWVADLLSLNWGRVEMIVGGEGAMPLPCRRFWYPGRDCLPIAGTKG